MKLINLSFSAILGMGLPTLQAQQITSFAWTSKHSPADTTLTITGQSPQLLLMRARASGGGLGISDPVVTVRNAATNTVLASNDNWAFPASSAMAVEAALSKLALPSMLRTSRDAAVLMRLAPGKYHVRTTGKAACWERAELEVFPLSNAADLKASTAVPAISMAQSTRGDLASMAVGYCSARNISTGVDGTVSKETKAKAAANTFFHIGSCGKAIKSST